MGVCNNKLVKLYVLTCPLSLCIRIPSLPVIVLRVPYLRVLLSYFVHTIERNCRGHWEQ
jgi:hypothetical protein